MHLKLIFFFFLQPPRALKAKLMLWWAHFPFILLHLHFISLNVMHCFHPLCLQDGRKLPRHGVYWPNAVHSWHWKVIRFVTFHLCSMAHLKSLVFDLLSFMSALYVVCSELTSSHNQNEEFCRSYMSKRCYFAEHVDWKKNKPLLFCQSSSPFMRPTLVRKIINTTVNLNSCL